MMTGLTSGLLDTTVTACDGAGTVISNNPNLVQGIGARISGLVETEPIDETINGINERGELSLTLQLPESTLLQESEKQHNLATGK